MWAIKKGKTTKNVRSQCSFMLISNIYCRVNTPTANQKKKIWNRMNMRGAREEKRRRLDSTTTMTMTMREKTHKYTHVKTMNFGMKQNEKSKLKEQQQNRIEKNDKINWRRHTFTRADSAESSNRAQNEKKITYSELILNTLNTKHRTHIECDTSIIHSFSSVQSAFLSLVIRRNSFYFVSFGRSFVLLLLWCVICATHVWEMMIMFKSNGLFSFLC